MWRKLRLSFVLAIVLMLALAGVGNVSASDGGYFLNARDFQGLLVTGSPTDSHNWFTWLNFDLGVPEIEIYEEASAAGVGVRQNIYPDIYITANVPAGTYRVWIYQIDTPDPWSRALETTVGSDAPVQTHFDPNVVGSTWAWQDVGIHDIAPGDQVTVRAVGAFINHGQDVPERRGAFKTILLATDLGDTPPAFVPDGQTTIQINAEPTVGEIYPGDTVDVDLSILDAFDLYGAQSECSVDPAVLEGQSSAWGDIFDPANRYVAEDIIDGVTGLWNGAISLLAPATPIDGDGAYVTLTYEGVAPGTTTVSCTSLLVNQDGDDLAHIYNGTSITVLPFATIDGVATYQGRSDHAGIDVTATGTLVTANDTTASDGSFILIDLKADTYDIVADAALYLPNCTSATVAPGDALTLANTRLRGGDTNDDDDVDIGDAALVAANFRQDVPPAAANADINGDGRVNIRDLVILASNYGRSGCQSW